METSSQRTAGGGLWNSPRAAQFSKETQDMMKFLTGCSRSGADCPGLFQARCVDCLGGKSRTVNTPWTTLVLKQYLQRRERAQTSDRSSLVTVKLRFPHFNIPTSTFHLMKQESRVTNLKRKQTNRCTKNEVALPLASHPAQPSPPGKPVQKAWPVHTQKRTAEACRSGNSYAREKFCPGPTRDLEKEKQKLQNIFALGTEQPRAGSSQKPLHHSSEAPKMDRYQEVLNEIEERRQFLEDMASLGQEKEYIDIINTEISQKIRELEILEKAQVPKSDTRTDSRTVNAANNED